MPAISRYVLRSSPGLQRSAKITCRPAGLRVRPTSMVIRGCAICCPLTRTKGRRYRCRHCHRCPNIEAPPLDLIRNGLLNVSRYNKVLFPACVPKQEQPCCGCVQPRLDFHVEFHFVSSMGNPQASMSPDCFARTVYALLIPMGLNFRLPSGNPFECCNSHFKYFVFVSFPGHGPPVFNIIFCSLLLNRNK